MMIVILIHLNLNKIWQDTLLPESFKSESLNQWCKYIDKNTKPEVVSIFINNFT